MERKLIIFDLNGVLIDRVHYKDLVDCPKGSLKLGNSTIWLRPKLKLLLKYCSRHFDIALWTCCNKRNTNKYLNLFKSINFKFVWNAEHCKQREINNEIFFYKDLNCVWNKMKQYNTTNTLLIDDSLYKVELNPVHNYYIPKRWDRKTEIKGRDEIFSIVSKLRHYKESIETFSFAS